VEVPVGGWDLVLRGGRVIDPESGLDAVRDVAVADGRIAAVGTGLKAGVPRGDVDVAGQVVTAGFVDLHSHVSDLGGLRLQALDGVTTALELEAGVPTFTHARDLIEMAPTTLADGAEEIVRAAAETGAHMHYCHVNSTSQRHVDRVLGLVARAQAAGSRVTTEAYPYGSGMTGLGAAFLAPERLGERSLSPSSLTYVPTSERVASGIMHVLVNGTFVVRDGSIVAGARPGRPVRGEPR
jgi:uncharacterized Zn-binding protein involved in type VI secretion